MVERKKGAVSEIVSMPVTVCALGDTMGHAHGGHLLTPFIGLVIIASPAHGPWWCIGRLNPVEFAPKERGCTIAASHGVLAWGPHWDYDIQVSDPSVVVLENTGSAWIEVATVRPPAPFNDPHAGFGRALATDGEWLVVGAPSDSVDAFESGAAHLFHRTEGQWKFARTFVNPTPQVNGHFGASVAVCGTRAAIGAPDARVAEFARAGTVAVYELAQGESSTPHIHTAVPIAASDRFGAAIALSFDTLAVGAPWTDFEAHNAGCVYLFELSGSGKLIERFRSELPVASGLFGNAVALDDSWLAIGEPRACGRTRHSSSGGFRTGALTIMRSDSPNAWRRLAVLDGLSQSALGTSVTVNAESGFVIAGAPGLRGVDPNAPPTDPSQRTIQTGGVAAVRLPPSASILAPQPLTLEWIHHCGIEEGWVAGADIAYDSGEILIPLQRDPELPPDGGTIIRVTSHRIVASQHLVPLRDRRTANEVSLDLSGIGMMRTKLDTELAHAASRPRLTVQDDRQFQLFEQHIPLLDQCGRSCRFTTHEISRLSKDPWITNTSSCHAHPLHARVLDHLEDIFDSPNVP